MRLPELEFKTTAVADPKDETKRLAFPFRVKAETLQEDGHTFEGLVSTWELDKGGDVIHKGAFKRTLGHWKSAGRPVPLMDSHSYSWSGPSVRGIVGKLEDAKETDEGLWTKWSVIDGPDGDEIWRRIKGGFVDGLSIGYRAIKTEAPTEAEQRTGIYRHLKEVELREGSVVLWPMNEGARIDPDSLKAELDAAEAGALTLEQLKELQTKLEALVLKASPPPSAAPAAPHPPASKDLAPDDPKRRALELEHSRMVARQLTSRVLRT